MPATQPGSLKPTEVAQLIAYVLQENKYPAGKMDLPETTDQQQRIHVEPPLSGGQ